MKFNSLNIDITLKNYLGKIDGGILTLISIKKDNTIYEGTFWYNQYNETLITFEKGVGIDPEKCEKRKEISEYLLSVTESWDKIYETLKELKFST